jgi:hypothetical protein
MALSLATTLGDLSLIRKSIKTGLAGITLGFSLSFVFGLLFSIDPSASQVVLRTSVDHWDVILALAVGVEKVHLAGIGQHVDALPVGGGDDLARGFAEGHRAQQADIHLVG